MRCLITGINGFAGTCLSEYLKEKDIDPALSTTKIGSEARKSGVEVTGTVFPKNLAQPNTFPCDLSIPQEIEDIIRQTRPDIVFHLAGQGYVPASWQDPIGTFNTNVLGTLYLLNAVRRFSPNAKILIIGSGDEYGVVDGGRPLSENTSLNPQNPYAVTKVCIDLLSGQLAGYYNLHIVRVRPFPHIGPGQSPNFAIADFCRQIALIEKKRQSPVIKAGNLKSRRDFTDVRDMIRAYWLAIEKGIPGEVYNISSEKAYSIEEILERLINLTKSDIKVEIDPSRLRPQDTEIKLGNSQKFRRLTGWKPQIPIEQTLRETLDWWREQV